YPNGRFASTADPEGTRSSSGSQPQTRSRSLPTATADPGRPPPGSDRQIRRLVLTVHLVSASAIYVGQEGAAATSRGRPGRPLRLPTLRDRPGLGSHGW